MIIMNQFTCIAPMIDGGTGNDVYMNTQAAEDNGYASRSPVRITGKKTTVAVLRYDPNIPYDSVGLGPTLRINAQCNEGDSVEIDQLKVQGTFSKVRIQPTTRSLEDQEIPSVKAAIRDVYLSKDDHFTVSLNGEPLELQVTRCRPQHGWLTPDIDIQIIGKKSRRSIIDVPSVSFDDIGGLDKTIEAIKEIAIVPLIHPEIYVKSGQEPPRGILLYGPPGVGKTLLARALAREAQCNFICISGPEIISGTYGASEKALREKFAEAKREAPSVIYIDEIDAIAGDRKNSRGELEKRIVTELLIQLDGFEDRGQVLVVGSTNLLETIDPALLRAGRFDRRIHVPYPDVNGRERILEIHSKNMPLEEVSLSDWAMKTVGCTGADLANLCRHASGEALHREFGLPRLTNPENFSEMELEGLKILTEDFEQAFEKFTPWATQQRRPATMGRVEMDAVIGHASAKSELIDHLVHPINNPEIYSSLGLSCSGGVLLHGPPGTGKTMLGRAAASLANVQFMAVSGPDFLSKWVGESERAVRELFQRAEELAPVVLFFDEFDAVGRNRDNSEGAHHSSSVVAQLLTMMDGLKPADGIYFMASTNKIELVDEAFLRPGRFSKCIEVGPLTNDLFFEFFQNQIKDIPSTISNQEWLNTVLRLKDKVTGAELKGLIDQIKHCSARRCIAEKTEVCLKTEDLEQGLRVSRHLFRTVASVEENVILDDDWDDDNDDEGEWVIP
ncbi:MAG TPA: AAA family ATPase [Candidatus Poseidoniaceae archaeon]|nr:AAA family ATPase [Candidatus Poseidoniaceae archaeon]